MALGWVLCKSISRSDFQKLPFLLSQGAEREDTSHFPTTPLACQLVSQGAAWVLFCSKTKGGRDLSGSRAHLKDSAREDSDPRCSVATGQGTRCAPRVSPTVQALSWRAGRLGDFDEMKNMSWDLNPSFGDFVAHLPCTRHTNPVFRGHTLCHLSTKLQKFW